MVYHLTGGAWGAVIRRVLEAATRTLPLLAMAALPLAFGLGHLYVWTDTAAVMADPVLAKKVAYLNVPFFLARAALYFVIWTGLALFLNRWSREQDRTGDPACEDRMRKLSGGGILLWGLATTFAAFDWIMSLDPHWFSTIFGILVAGGQGLSTLAFAIAAQYVLARRKLVGDIYRPSYLNDLGNLLFAFVMLWAYFSFSQFLIIWSANLPEEIPWYLHRLVGGWQWVAGFLALFHFFVPFFILLSRRAKRRLAALAGIAAFILAVRLVDVFYLVAPEFNKTALSIHWMDVASFVGLGGLWLAAFGWQLGSWPLLPLHDRELESALARHE